MNIMPDAASLAMPADSGLQTPRVEYLTEYLAGQRTAHLIPHKKTSFTDCIKLSSSRNSK